MKGCYSPAEARSYAEKLFNIPLELFDHPPFESSVIVDDVQQHNIDVCASPFVDLTPKRMSQGSPRVQGANGYSKENILAVERTPQSTYESGMALDISSPNTNLSGNSRKRISFSPLQSEMKRPRVASSSKQTTDSAKKSILKKNIEMSSLPSPISRSRAVSLSKQTTDLAKKSILKKNIEMSSLSSPILRSRVTSSSKQTTDSAKKSILKDNNELPAVSSPIANNALPTGDETLMVDVTCVSPFESSVRTLRNRSIPLSMETSLQKKNAQKQTVQDIDNGDFVDQIESEMPKVCSLTPEREQMSNVVDFDIESEMPKEKKRVRAKAVNNCSNMEVQAGFSYLQRIAKKKATVKQHPKKEGFVENVKASSTLAIENSPSQDSFHRILQSNTLHNDSIHSVVKKQNDVGLKLKKGKSKNYSSDLMAPSSNVDQSSTSKTSSIVQEEMDGGNDTTSKSSFAKRKKRRRIAMPSNKKKSQGVQKNLNSTKVDTSVHVSPPKVKPIVESTKRKARVNRSCKARVNRSCTESDYKIDQSLIEELSDVDEEESNGSWIVPKNFPSLSSHVIVGKQSEKDDVFVRDAVVGSVPECLAPEAGAMFFNEKLAGPDKLFVNVKDPIKNTAQWLPLIFSAYDVIWDKPNSHKETSYEIHKYVSDDRFSVGMIRLFPKGTKPKQKTKKHNATFVLLSGTLKVTINDTTATRTSGAWFFSPCGSCYSLENLEVTEARVLYTICPA